MRKRIGIYGGTFDPIHNGHLILAREAREQLHLQTIIFVPAAVSPFKNTPAGSPADRLAMLQAAIAGESGFAIDEFELHRPPPSYTIDTVENIRDREADAELFYLIGRDNIPGLTKWHRFGDIQNLVQFIVLDRPGESSDHPYQVVHRNIDISATEIRNRVASNRSIRYLVPESVNEIIKSRGLYQES
ncbi:MAG TPA: nicotinate-nucleotide adenylyltransferase [Chthoniobacterales bacterium]|nr:nicotinate-nucleotide adenylyltransferase [Chthoniobacterales bacterium]